jgi:3-hydroxypropionyl-coenzyme A dehydratase
MITAEEAERIGLVNIVVRLSIEEEVEKDDKTSLPAERSAVTTTSTTQSSTSPQEEQQQQQEKQRVNEVAKILNKKLMDECLSLAKEIAKNSSTAVKTSKILINKGMDEDIDTGLLSEVCGWSLCFAHEDRQKMMSSFLDKANKKK